MIDWRASPPKSRLAPRASEFEPAASAARCSMSAWASPREDPGQGHPGRGTPPGSDPEPCSRDHRGASQARSPGTAAGQSPSTLLPSVSRCDCDRLAASRAAWRTGCSACPSGTRPWPGGRSRPVAGCPLRPREAAERCWPGGRGEASRWRQRRRQNPRPLPGRARVVVVGTSPRGCSQGKRSRTRARGCRSRGTPAGTRLLARIRHRPARVGYRGEDVERRGWRNWPADRHAGHHRDVVRNRAARPSGRRLGVTARCAPRVPEDAGDADAGGRRVSTDGVAGEGRRTERIVDVAGVRRSPNAR